MCHGGRGTMRCQYKCLVIEEAIFTWRQYNIGPTKLKLLISVSAPVSWSGAKISQFLDEIDKMLDKKIACIGHFCL